MADLKEIYRINQIVENLNPGQISIEPTEDADSGIKMFVYKDYDGTVRKVICQNTKAVVSELSSTGQVTGDNIRYGNFDATSDPGPTNDTSEAYTKGSMWFNNTTGGLWLCADATENAAVWDLLAGTGGTIAGFFQDDTGIGAARNPNSITTRALGEFSFAQGQNTRAGEDGDGSVVMGRDNQILNADSLVVGRSNFNGYEESDSIGGAFTVTASVGGVATIDGPSWPFPIYDGGGSYSEIYQPRRLTVTLSGFSNAGNNGSFPIIKIVDGVVQIRSTTCLLETSPIDAKVSIDGGLGSVVMGYNNVSFESPYSLVQGSKCYSMRAPYSVTTGNSAVNIWPGAHVHSNGAMSLVSGSQSEFEHFSQTITNVNYSGTAFEDQNGDLTLFFGSTVGVTIDNEHFQFRPGYRYDITAEVQANNAPDEGTLLYLQRTYNFSVMCEAENLTDCYIDGPIIETIKRQSVAASTWTFEPSLFIDSFSSGGYADNYVALRFTVNSDFAAASGDLAYWQASLKILEQGESLE